MINKKEFKNAQYYQVDGVDNGIKVTIEGVVCCIPLTDRNQDYKDLMEAVENGEITIAPADEGVN